MLAASFRRFAPAVVALGATALLASTPGCRRSSPSPSATDATAPSAATEPAAPGEEARTAVPDGGPLLDPFCGVHLRAEEAAVVAEYDGITYGFCLEDHRQAFFADPEGALERLRAREAGADGGP